MAKKETGRKDIRPGMDASQQEKLRALEQTLSSIEKEFG